MRFTNTGTSSISYQASVRTVTSPPTAGIGLGDTATGTFTVTGQHITYAFTLTDTREVFLDLLSGAGTLNWTLRDPVGQPVFARVDANNVTVQNQGPFTLVAGTYTIDLDLDFGALPSFSFKLVEVIDQSLTAAPGDVVDGAIATPGATVTYTISVPAPQRLYVDLQLGNNNLHWTLRDPVGEPYFSDALASSTTTNDRGPFEIPAGTFTLLLDADNDTVPAFRFGLFSGADTLTHIAIGDVVSGAIGAPGDRLTYDFDVTSGPARLYFDVLQAASNLEWSLMNPVGETIFATIAFNNPGDDKGPMTLPAGVYRIDVGSLGGARPSFQFKVSSVTDTTAAITLDQLVTATVPSVGGVARFTFEPAFDGQLVDVDLTQGAANLKWSLLDPVGTAVFPNVVPSSATSDDQGTFALTAGTYTLVVDGDTHFAQTIQFVVRGTTLGDREFYYTRFSGLPNLKKASYSYVNGVFTIHATTPIANLPSADGLLFAPDGDIVVGGGGNIHKVDPDTGSFRTIDNVGTAHHVSLDPSGTIIWAAAAGTSKLVEIPLAPIGAGVEHTLFGDDTAVTQVIFDLEGNAYYTRSGPGGNGNFGRIDLTTMTTTRLIANVGAAHGAAFDTYTGHIMLFGDGHITQIDPASPAVFFSDLALNGTGTPNLGVTLDQGTTDGEGHILVCDNNGKIVFLDYSVSGKVNDTRNVLYAEFLDSSLDDVAPISFLGSACEGVPTPSTLDPADGATFPPGTRITLSGRVVPRDSTRPIVAVFVNGRPVDSLDATGNFFTVVDIEPGDNAFVIETVERCGTSKKTLHFSGLTDEEVGFEHYQDVTLLVAAGYRDTTFALDTSRHFVDVRASNGGATSIEGPLLLAIEDDLPPSIDTVAPDGITPEGLPYYIVVPDGQTLAPGADSAYVPLAFENPARALVCYTERWLAPANRAPSFVTAPPTSARAGVLYSYDADAVDPDGNTLSFTLDLAPAGMTVDAATGVVTWTPATGDDGLHHVTLVAHDGRGGRAVQRYTVTVGAQTGNRPPVFTTAPVTHAAIGAAYAYDANAADLDGDTLAFALLQGPAGMTIDATTGLVTWGFAEAGSYNVIIEVADGQGGEAAQTWTLAVGSPPANPGAPQILSAPPALASVADLYLYQPVAVDDDGDVLTYTLLAAPAGMSIDAATGRITWTPNDTQIGSHAVVLRVSDGQGGEALQTYAVTVLADAPNRPPFFTTTPPTFAIVATPFTYDAHAQDPEFETVTYALLAGPAGLGVGSTTGLVSWTPGAGDVGIVTVALTATDESGNVGHQVFRLDVRAANNAPAFTSTPPANAAVGATYRYDANAVDPDGDALAFALTQAPAGMRVDAVTGVVTWTPTLADVGGSAVTLRASDCCGGVATQSWTVTVAVDTTDPSVVLEVPAAPHCIGRGTRLCVDASDDNAVATRSLTRDGVNVPLDGAGCASVVITNVGSVAFVARAVDASGNDATAITSLDFVDCTDTTKPTVTVHAPAAGTVVFEPVAIVATIGDDQPANLSWEVSIAPVGSDDFRVIDSGTGAVTNATIATFDPTLLPNGDWRVRVVAGDTVQASGVEIVVGVSGDLKLGSFSVDFIDLAVPVAGVHLAIRRGYNSLDTAQYDFGNGWRLGLSGQVTDTPDEIQGNDLVALLGTEAFTSSTHVYITRPDGRRIGFTWDPSPLGFPAIFQVRPHFRPDPGVTDTLEAVNPLGSIWSIGGRYFNFIIPFNPRTYILTTKTGVKYTIDEVDGLRRVEDRNGNTLDVTPGGIVSSTGVSIAFERDAAGRITRIVEPDDPDDPAPPGALRYEYDPVGNLIAFMDQAGSRTEYHYDEPAFPHYLTRIDDPLGRPLSRMVYDAEGRLAGTCPPDGNLATLEGCIRFDPDVEQRVQDLVTARGTRIQFFYDGMGNIVRERRYTAAASFVDITRTYDANHNLLAETDPDGNVTRYTYDARGNKLSMTDTGNRTTTYEYDAACDKVTRACDPSGNCYRFEYDTKCNPTRVTDPLGGMHGFEYDARGRRTAYADPAGSTTRYEYDLRGRLSRILDPSTPVPGETRYTYDARGNLKATVDPTGKRIDFQYDAAHRLTRETWNDGRVTTYEYDAGGQVTRVASPDCTYNYTYWNTGMPRTLDNTGTAGAPPVTITYGYDDGGVLRPGHDAHLHVTHVTDSAGGLTRYEYDALDRMASVTQQQVAVAPGAAPERRVEYTYDGADMIRRVDRFSDVGGTAPVATTHVEYQCGACSGRTTAIHHRAPGGGVIEDIDLVRDGLGDILSITDGQGAHAYTYDGLGRLLTVTHPAGGTQPDERYTYDAVGNRLSSHLSTTYTYGKDLGEGGNRLRSDARGTYTYDAAGRLAQLTDTAGNVTAYAYDHRGRLVGVEREDAGGTPTGSAHYTYDAFDRRIRSDEDGVVRHYAYDSRNPVLVLDDTGAVVSRRMYGRTTDDVLAHETGGATRWLLTDQVRSVRVIVTDDPTVDATRVYDSFGRTMATTGGAAQTDLRFQGREFSDVTGLGYFRKRWYDPHVGRFLSPDPLLPFAYEGLLNTPVRRVDPRGESVLIEYACFALDAYQSASDFADPVSEFIITVADLVVQGLNGEPVDPQAAYDAVNTLLEGLYDALLGLIIPFPIPSGEPGDAAGDVAAAFCFGHDNGGGD